MQSFALRTGLSHVVRRKSSDIYLNSHCKFHVPLLVIFVCYFSHHIASENAVCMYDGICVCVCVSIYIYIYIYICINVCMHACMQACIYELLCVCIHNTKLARGFKQFSKEDLFFLW
jgi:hypothetical protein